MRPKMLPATAPHHRNTRVIIIDLRHGCVALKTRGTLAHLERICKDHGCGFSFGCGPVLHGRPLPDLADAMKSKQVNGAFLHIGLLSEDGSDACSTQVGPAGSPTYDALMGAANAVLGELTRQYHSLVGPGQVMGISAV